MAEYTVVSQDHRVSYTGYVDLRDFWRHVRIMLVKKGYTYLEVEHNEVFRKNKKQVYLKTDCDRQLSDDAKGRIKTKLTVKDAKDVTIEIDGRPRKLQECSLTLSVTTYVIMDWQGRYQHVARLFFLRRIYQKFFGVRELQKFVRLIQRDHDDVIRETKNYLNMQDY